MSENKVLDPMAVEASLTTIYPEEFKPMCVGREKRKIGDELGLNNFGVNLVTLKTGAASSQSRHRFFDLVEDEGFRCSKRFAMVMMS